MAKNKSDDDDQEESTHDLVLEEILIFLLKKYKPAANIQQASLMKTTGEIIDSISLFYPGALLPSNTLHTLLTKAGFKYDCVDDMQFVWLMKE